MTVRDMLERTLRLIRVLAKGESINTSDAVDALEAMNGLIDSSKNDGFLIYENQIQTLALVSSQQKYTIGVGGDFDVERPVAINKATYMLGEVETDIKVVTAEQWSEINVKDISGEVPCKLYYNPSFPLGQISLWPKPSATGSIKIYTPKPIDKFTSINAIVSIPPGYEEFLVYGTGLRLAPEYGTELTQSQMKILSDAKAGIMRQNTTPVYSNSDPFGSYSDSSFYDIYTGGSRR